MLIQLGQRIKTLRKNRDMTQEELAECLGVSYQAVSRWERGEGYPDITTLPLLAEFFNISTDELLGLDREKRQQQVRERLRRGAEYFNKQDYLNAVEVLRGAVSEFPNSEELMTALMQALDMAYAVKTEAGDEKSLGDELVTLGKRLLSRSLDDTLRTKAKDILCRHYLFNLNDTEKAREIIATMPGFDYMRAFIPALCLEDVREKQKAYQQMIMDHARVVAGAIRSYMGCDDTLTDDVQLGLFQRLIQMFEVLFDGAYSLDVLLVSHLALAKLYTKLGEHENAMQALLKCNALAERFDRYNTLPETSTYDTPLLSRLPVRPDSTTAFEKNETHNISLRAALLSELDRDSAVYAPLQAQAAYQQLIRRLGDQEPTLPL